MGRWSATTPHLRRKDIIFHSPTSLPPGWEREAREKNEDDGLRAGLLVVAIVGGRYIDE